MKDPQPSRPATFLVVSGWLVAAGLGAAVGYLARGEGDSAPLVVPSGADPGRVDLGRMESELARLAELLEQRALLDAGAPAPRASAADFEAPRRDNATDEPARRVALGGGDEALRQELEALREEVHALRRILTLELARLGGSDEVFESIRNDPRDPDWSEWDAVVALWHGDPEVARDQVEMLSAAEVLERFGPPTDVWQNENGLTWQYADDARVEEIILRVPEGYVTRLVVRATTR